MAGGGLGQLDGGRKVCDLLFLQPFGPGILQNIIAMTQIIDDQYPPRFVHYTTERRLDMKDATGGSSSHWNADECWSP